MSFGPRGEYSKIVIQQRIKLLGDAFPAGLSPLVEAMHTLDGRLTVPPERLLKAKVLHAPLIPPLINGVSREATSALQGRRIEPEFRELDSLTQVLVDRGIGA